MIKEREPVSRRVRWNSMTSLKRSVVVTVLFGVTVLPVVSSLAQDEERQRGSTPPESTDPIGGPQDDSSIQFFESKIRPLLIRHCLECHGSDSSKVRGGLRLTSRKEMLIGGDSGPAIEPGKPDQSLLISSVHYEDFEMPPSGQLKPSEIAALGEWIERGAPDPRKPGMVVDSRAIDIKEGKSFWAFQPREKIDPPSTADPAWPRTSIDQFILATLESHKIKPVGEATRETLIRRASIDLIGLPPTVDEIDAFINDPDRTEIAFERVVDRLLASRHFGERWGRHWLDVVRFAESSGGGRSLMFPLAWRFRDFVISSFNSDKPFDLFLKQQIAGDLLPSESHDQRVEQLIAVGMLVLGPVNLDQQDKELLRMEVVDEQVDTVGRAFMGMTLGCARCHDHKFDPIPTRDYYAIAGIFGATQSLVTRNVSSLVERSLSTPEALAIESDYRTRLDELNLKLANTQAGSLREQLKEELRQIQSNPPPATVYAMSVNDVDSPTDGHLHIRGSIRNLGPVVPRGLISVCCDGPPALKLEGSESGRLQLAEWMASPNHPLTARVYVNRVWHHLFGAGLVTTTDNFGLTGTRPSHPALLDFLANQFVADGWSTKKLIRAIMLSRVYQLSAASDANAGSIDPTNQLLWRSNRRRVEAEVIRDSILFVSGDIDMTPGGLTIREVTEFDREYQFESRKRSVYVPAFRNSRMALLDVFDLANPSMVVGNRSTSTLPTQALFLMNSPVVMDQSKKAAERLIARKNLGDCEKIVLAYRQALGRAPTDRELESAIAYIGSFDSSAADNDFPDHDMESAAWTSLYHSLFASLEFRYID